MKQDIKEAPLQNINRNGDTENNREFMACLQRLWLNEPVKFGIYVGFSFLILVVIMSLGLEYAYKPQTCILCHEMKTAHETWRNSSHGPLKGGSDDCLGCHVAPGFGNKIKAKLGGVAFLWDHAIGNYEDDIKAELPVFCVRSGCHTNPWEMDRGSRVRVNHALHLSKGYGCVVCHDRIAHGDDPKGLNLPGMKNFCFPCHNDEIASRTNCQFCHVYQAAMLDGFGSEGLQEGNTSVHQIENISCIGCHTEGCNPQPIQVCAECHLERYVYDFESQKKWALKSLAALEDGIIKLETAINQSEEMGYEISQLNGIYNLVKNVYTFVRADNSKGAHNLEYTRLLISNAVEKLNFAYLIIERRGRRMQ